MVYEWEKYFAFSKFSVDLGFELTRVGEWGNILHLRNTLHLPLLGPILLAAATEVPYPYWVLTQYMNGTSNGFYFG